MPTGNCSCKVFKESKAKKPWKDKKLPAFKGPLVIPSKTQFLDRFHETKICYIPATGPPKADAMDLFRPPSRTVLDYKLSQMDTKLEREVKDGIQKFHITNTVGYYLPYPPGVEPPPKKPVKITELKLFNGGPPCCKYLDDIWAEQMEKNQEKYRKNLEVFIEKRILRDKAERKAKREKKLAKLQAEREALSKIL